MSLYNGEASVVCPSVYLSVCKLLRKSLLLPGKWPDRHQTFTRWTPGQRASRMCSRSRLRSRSRDMRTFLDSWNELLRHFITTNCLHTPNRLKFTAASRGFSATTRLVSIRHGCIMVSYRIVSCMLQIAILYSWLIRWCCAKSRFFRSDARSL